MENLRSNEQRAKNAVLLIWLVLVAEVISLVSGSFQYLMLQDIKRGVVFSPETLSSNDSREQIVAIIYMIVYIASAVTFILWFRRAYFNLHLRVDYLSHPDNAAASSWFIPVICLFRPFQIMKELFVESRELLDKNGVLGERSVSISFLNIWWTLWIISNFLGQFVFRYSLKAETIEELNIVTVASIVSNLIGIPLALVTVKIIKSYASVETRLDGLLIEEEFETEDVNMSNID